MHKPSSHFNPESIQDSWIIPLLLEGMICGIAQVSLSNRLMRVSVLGSAPMMKKQWFSPHFFRKPPEQYMIEIKKRYQDYQLSDPLLTYDDSPKVRHLFSFANIYEWELQYGMNNYKQKKAKKGRELFISNFKIPFLENIRENRNEL